MALLPEEARHVRRDHVEEMDDLVAGRIGQEQLEVVVVACEPERAHPLADARPDEAFLAFVEGDAAQPVDERPEPGERPPGQRLPGCRERGRIRVHLGSYVVSCTTTGPAPISAPRSADTV